MTGEEFICWSSIDSTKYAGTYVGTDAALGTLRQYLDLAVPYYLNDEQTGIERRDWLETLYCPTPVGGTGGIAFGSVHIQVEGDRVVIQDGGSGSTTAARLPPRISRTGFRRCSTASPDWTSQPTHFGSSSSARATATCGTPAASC